MLAIGRGGTLLRLRAFGVLGQGLRGLALLAGGTSPRTKVELGEWPRCRHRSHTSASKGHGSLRVERGSPRRPVLIAGVRRAAERFVLGNLLGRLPLEDLERLLIRVGRLVSPSYVYEFTDRTGTGPVLRQLPPDQPTVQLSVGIGPELAHRAIPQVAPAIAGPIGQRMMTVLLAVLQSPDGTRRFILEPLGMRVGVACNCQ